MNLIIQILLIASICVITIRSQNPNYDEAMKKAIELKEHIRIKQVTGNTLMFQDNNELAVDFAKKTREARNATNVYLYLIFGGIEEKTLTVQQAEVYLKEIEKIATELPAKLIPELDKISVAGIRQKIEVIYAAAPQQFETISKELLALL